MHRARACEFDSLCRRRGGAESLSRPQAIATSPGPDSRSRRLTAWDALVYSRVPSEIKLYSREWCSWCIDAKEYLTEKGYRFNIVDVGKDRQAYEEMKKLSEQTYVPTFVAGGRVLANFDTDQLQKFLNEHQINP